MARIDPIRTAAWVVLAALIPVDCALAQAQLGTTQLAPVNVNVRTPAAASIAGWGDIALSRLPLQANVFSADQLKDVGAQRLADLIGLDAALGDAYNAVGYWDFLTVRGFVLDNRFNYRRDGLPLNTETAIAIDNKARVEVLKGLSGLQAGTSAPGGLVNYVVKRPTDSAFTSASLEWRQRGDVIAATDLNRRFGESDSVGLRLNAAAARIEPQLRAARGERHLLALAGEWRMSPATLLELEGETSRRSQPSMPGFSLLGNNVPDARSIEPRINLNNQAWSLPVVLEGNTTSLRLTHRLNADWTLIAHGATQRLRSDDRVAFPFGCSDPNPAPNGTYYPDRYCPNGNFDLYEFRSDDERRRTDAIEASVSGRFRTGPLRHEFQAGLLRSLYRARLGPQIFDFAGTGSVTGTLTTPPSAGTLAANTNRSEQSNELHLRDAVNLDAAATLWLGVRHTRLQRESIGTDGSSPVSYAQSITTPWIAGSYALAPDQLVYFSWGKGVESEVVPNLPRYSNRGQALPALKSRQFEAGIKGVLHGLDWGFAGFDIVRPTASDIGNCDNTIDSCERVIDGNAHHRGVEVNASTRVGEWTLRAGSQWLRARREGSQVAALNGQQPTNVPAFTAKLQLGYAVASLPGMNLQGGAIRESRRQALPDNSASIPGYTRLDAAIRYDVRMGQAASVWRAGVDNLADARAWKESPYQFGHAYLYPLAPRTWRVALQVDL